jgi:hypothetical protein
MVYIMGKKEKKKETMCFEKNETTFFFCEGKFQLDNMPSKCTRNFMPVLDKNKENAFQIMGGAILVNHTHNRPLHRCKRSLVGI